MPEVFALKLAGPAGSGILSAGETLFGAIVKSGYYALGYPEYPSLIKGGHNTYLITVSDSPFPNNSPKVDLLLALTQTALDNEHKYIQKDCHVVADVNLKANHEHKKLYQPALLAIAKNVGNPLTLNTVMIGFASHQLELNSDRVWGLIQKGFAGKSQTLIDQNKLAFDNSIELSRQYHLEIKLPKQNNKSSQLVMNGSQGMGLGAIAAGINLYAGYPMTPSSQLLHFMAAHQTEFNYLVRQTEDELCAINLIVGASFSGAKSMTGTSGGGFTLMQEGISLAAMVETPIVICLAMRPAPATGLPTWTSQSDLFLAINAGHGEFAKIVLAPSDPGECYHLTHRAFYLSQTYHCPVIILTDKYLAENNYSIPNLPALESVALSAVSPSPKDDEMFSRYQFTPNGIHDRTLPGMPGGEYLANSDEHEATGLIDESIETRRASNERRRQRHDEIKKNIPLPEITGEGETAIISWGSHKCIVRELANDLKMTHIHFNHLWPLPVGLEDLLRKYSHLISIENNETHQLARLIRQETGVNIQIQLGEDTGRPLDPEKLIALIKNA